MPELLDKYFNVRIKLQNNSEENWVKKDFVPLDGEVIIYDIDDKKYNRYYQLIKIGDGFTNLSQLPFVNQIEEGREKGTFIINGRQIKVPGIKSMAFENAENYINEMNRLSQEIETLNKIVAGDSELSTWADIAVSGNVNDLVQNSGDYLILNSNFEY